MPDQIVFEESGSVIETPPEPAGPSGVAEMIIKLRGETSFPAAPLSESGVRRLIELAFFLSIHADEGRYPRLRIVCGKPSAHQLAVQFCTPIKFSDVREIRRLAPVANNADFVLLLTETVEDGLECVGLANVGGRGLESQPGRPEIVPVGSPPSLRIWIEGPGHLFIQEIGVGAIIELRAGQVRLMRPVMDFVPTLREWISQISGLLHDRAIKKTKDIPGASKFFGGAAGLFLITHIVLQQVLATCMKLRHGGAFVILPGSSRKLEEYGITCKYRLEGPDLGEDLANYWMAHIRASNSKGEGVEAYDRELRRCYQSKAVLLTNVNVVANMSAADGCVILTNQLRLLGFGGSIKVSDSECRSAERQYRFSKDESCELDQFLGSVGGERHQSAARLVTKHDEVRVFVISQDAVLSAFLSDEDGYVRRYGPLDPGFDPDAG